MLVKCVCSNCSHSYLADDQVGSLSCPRCGVNNESERDPSDIPGSPMDTGPDPGGYEPYAAEEGYGFEMDLRFDPQAPPPMYVTGERMIRGVVFGAVATVLAGALLGGAMAAVQLVVPVVAAVLIALVAGATTRYGFGGRTATRTTGRALFTLMAVVLLGFGGFVAGSWGVERFTGTADRDADGVADVEQTRADLDEGLRGLVRERARNPDAGTTMLLDQRITEAERLKQMSNAELEDYLWVQQAQVNQPLLAYAKLRVLNGPVVRLPKGNPVKIPSPAPAALLLGEVILAAFLGMRAVSPR